MCWNCCLRGASGKIAGFDGGQRQWFRIEITDQKTGILIANLSSTQPTFAVNGLDSERLLKIAVMAVNSKGASDRVILEAYTLKAPEKRLSKFRFGVYLCRAVLHDRKIYRANMGIGCKAIESTKYIVYHLHWIILCVCVLGIIAVHFTSFSTHTHTHTCTFMQIMWPAKQTEHEHTNTVYTADLFGALQPTNGRRQHTRYSTNTYK